MRPLTLYVGYPTHTDAFPSCLTLVTPTLVLAASPSRRVNFDFGLALAQVRVLHRVLLGLGEPRSPETMAVGCITYTLYTIQPTPDPTRNTMPFS